MKTRKEKIAIVEKYLEKTSHHVFTNGQGKFMTIRKNETGWKILYWEEEGNDDYRIVSLEDPSTIYDRIIEYGRQPDLKRVFFKIRIFGDKNDHRRDKFHAVRQYPLLRKKIQEMLQPQTIAVS